MVEWDYSRTWYHGSPFELTFIRRGGTITPDRRLAEVFCHKPPIVSISNDWVIKHNGTASGYLYRIAEDVGPDDVHPHPRSTIGKEWLTNRDLRVETIGPVSLTSEELLTTEEIEELRERGRLR